jgi:hypothetical protein
VGPMKGDVSWMCKRWQREGYGPIVLDKNVAVSLSTVLLESADVVVV